MPLKQNSDVGLNFKGTSQKLNGSGVGGNMDESHRLNFLINNLKDSMEQSVVSNGSNNRYDKEDSVNKSVLSRGVVKKYHI